MKKTIAFVILLGLSLSLSACKSQEEKKMEQLDKTMNQITDIQEQMIKGEIDNQEAEKLMEENRAEQKEIMNTAVTAMPNWVKELGLSEPKGMKFNEADSEVTNEKEHGFNSAKLVYTGDQEIALKEAKSIAEAAKIPLSAEYKMAVETMESMRNMPGLTEDALKEMEANMMNPMYANFSLGDLNNTADSLEEQYQISIQTEDDGTLIINVINFKQADQAISPYMNEMPMNDSTMDENMVNMEMLEEMKQ